MKYYVLFNPKSNNSRGREEAEKVKDFYTGITLDFVDSTTIDYKTFLASISADDKLIICGGDGTLNFFVNSVGDMNFTNDIYYFATGNGNDFLKDIGEEKGCAPVDITKYLKKLPVVEVGGKSYKFINNVGFGIDGYCCEVGDKLKETSDKPINYTSIAIKGLLGGFKRVNATVTVDGVEHQYKNVWLAPTMFGRFYGGGMMPTPEQDRLNKDGTVSVMIMHCGSKLKTLIAFPSIFKGEHVKKKKIVDIFTGKEIKVVFDTPTAIQVDGETILGMTEYVVHYAK